MIKRLISLLFIILVYQYGYAQQPIDIDFFAKVKGISSLQEKNGNIFFILRQADLSQDTYKSDLYQLIDGRAVALTSTGNVSSFLLLDDTILLRKSQKRVNKDMTVFYKLTKGYGEAMEWLHLPYCVKDIEFIDTNHFFFTAQQKLSVTKDNLPDSLIAVDASVRYRIFDELPFWSNGRGDINGLRSYLYYYDKGKITLLSDTLSSVSNIVLSPDKKSLAYTLKEHSNRVYEKNRLYVLDVVSKRYKEWQVMDEANYGQLHFIDDNHLFVSVHKRLKENPQSNAPLYQLNIKTGEYKDLYDGDLYVPGNSVLSDIKYGNRSKITFDKTGIRYVSTVIDYAPLIHLNYSDHSVSYLTPKNVNVDEYIPYKKGFLLIATEDQQGQEIYYLDEKRKLVRQTHINIDLFASHQIVAPQLVIFTNRNGLQLKGYVLPPANMETGKKYPTILDIHGGPRTVYGTSFFHEMQYWANLGYAVIFTNPTGSSGRGSDFAKLEGDFGGIDYDDLMCFVDTVIERVNYIDKERLGVTGGSYGGIMTNWIIGHTNRFRAAVSQRSISSWISFTTLSDIGYSFGLSYSGSDPWNDLPKLWKQSPLAYADQVKTPTLFIHSEEDYRCPLPEGLQMYSALRHFGVPSRIVIFKRENHELSRGGKPLNRIKRLYEITNWFQSYL